jgi:hypothetical protein
VLQSFGDLLRAAYGGNQRRLIPKKAEIAAMSCAAKLEPSEREELLGRAASDRTLERTRELMLLGMARFDTPALVSQLREFVGEVLRRHPAFLAESLAAALENRPDGPSEEGAVRTLTTQAFTALQWPQGSSALNKKEAEQCRLNALRCLLLWFRQTRGTTIERIERYLQNSVWASVAQHYKTDLQKLRVLLNTRDAAGIAVACSVLEKRALEQNQRAAAAREAEERATMRAPPPPAELVNVKTQVETATVEIKHLTEEISNARLAHENEIAHMRNDYEELRGRILRRLREELSLLDEGMHALRRDPPKVHVMEDHAERAIDGLKREMERIKQDEIKEDK